MPDQPNDISFQVLHSLEMFLHSHHSFYSDKNHLKDCIVVQNRLVKDHLYFDLDQRSRSLVVKIKITHKRSRSLAMIYLIIDQDQRSNHKTICSHHLEFHPYIGAVKEVIT